jgi:nucleotide-binding universal stress UspA family protein
MAKPILVGYDPRARDRAPVEFGVAASRFTGAPLVVASVHAGNPIQGVFSHDDSAQVDEDLVADCREVLSELDDELKAAGVAVRCMPLASTTAARALHDAAEREDAGLLVVGSSNRSTPGRAMAGTTSMRLLHGAPCPVAVVPHSYRRLEQGPRTIGVAFVNTEEGREALRGAYALARRAGATLHAFTVVRVTAGMHLEAETGYREGQFGKSVETVEGEHRVAAERELRNTVSALGDDVPVDVDALVGDPAQAIVDVSDSVDLLVCGSRGYGPVRAVMLGSVTRRVTAEAQCPVIVLPRGVRASLEALVAEAPGAAARA